MNRDALDAEMLEPRQLYAHCSTLIDGTTFHDFLYYTDVQPILNGIMVTTCNAL